MKRILSVCLVLVMLLSTFGITASAASEPFVSTGYYDVESDDICYILYEGEDYREAYVAGYMIDQDNIVPAGDRIIPENITYEGKKYVVKGVESGAFYESLFTSITLPSTINYMGDAAFESSQFLKNVVIPDTCNFIYFGDVVFSGTPYESVLYSTDEKIIGKNVLFSYIGNADPYVMPEEIDIIVPNAFFMSGVKSVVFNEKITEIPYFAFASCRNLKSVNIPDNIEYIAEGAFKDCSNLETVTLGEGVIELGVDSFANTKIKSIHLGPNVYNTLGAFKGCKALETITIDPQNEYYLTDGNALYFNMNSFFEGYESDEYLLEYYIPSKAQGKITLNSDVRMIGDYAFYGCDKLEEVSAKTIIEIGYSAFANSGIKKVTADEIVYIWDGAFKNCKNLTDIDLTETLEISTAAFENCTALTNVTFSEDIYYIGELAFSNTGLTEVTISGYNCYICESAFKGCKNLTSVRLEEGVSFVGMNAFLDCPNLKTIYMSKTVKYFENNAFNGCDNVTFELLRNTEAYKYIKNNTDFDFEVVGNYSLFQRIIDFFLSLFGLI